MDKKNKLIFIIAGAVILLAIAALSGVSFYRNSQQSEPLSENTVTSGCDQSSPDCPKSQEAVISLSENEEEADSAEENNAGVGSKSSDLKYGTTSGVSSNENEEQADDEEADTDDGITVETELDDE